MSTDRDRDRDRDQQGKEKSETRVELKYCEGCGGLGVRVCGGGQVYCNDCARKLAEMAVSKTTSRRPTLPVGRRSLLDDCAGPNHLDFNHRDVEDHDGNDDDVNDPDPHDLDATAWNAGGAA
jgi:hypothetical protein